jgi:glycosyltransferase involved in cell wall biosynthesis
MKIAFVEPHLKCVGGIRRIVETANRLIKLFGHQVDIYSPTGSPCQWLLCLAPVKKISALHKDTYDVAIFNLAEQYSIMKGVKAKIKAFWVLAPEAAYKQQAIPIQALKAGFFLLANSSYTVQYIRQHIAYPTEIPIIPGGINKEHFRYDSTIPKQYNILYYGSSRPWKGSQVVQAMLTRSSPRMLSSFMMEGKNTPQNKMHTLYNSADVYVSANLVEGFSFGQLEAMACGCAVVTTDDGGSRDYVKNMHNAVVVPRLPGHLYDAVVRVLTNKELRRTLIKNGLETANQARFDWDSNTGILEKVLRAQLKI